MEYLSGWILFERYSILVNPLIANRKNPTDCKHIALQGQYHVGGLG